MEDIRVPVRVNRRVSASPARKPPHQELTSAAFGVRGKAVPVTNVELHRETSRFVVDLRAAVPQKIFTADITHTGAHPWEIHADNLQELPVRQNSKKILKSKTQKSKTQPITYNLQPIPSKGAKGFRFQVSGFRKGGRRLNFGFAFSIIAVALVVPVLGQVG